MRELTSSAEAKRVMPALLSVYRNIVSIYCEKKCCLATCFEYRNDVPFYCENQIASLRIYCQYTASASFVNAFILSKHDAEFSDTDGQRCDFVLSRYFTAAAICLLISAAMASIWEQSISFLPLTEIAARGLFFASRTGTATQKSPSWVSPSSSAYPLFRI